MMTDEWFDQYLYQIAVPRNLVPKKLRDIFEQQQGDPVVLPLWDPFGSLA